MSESAIERAARSKVLWLKHGLERRDRGVILAFALSAVPIPPTVCVGLLLTAANYLLWKKGKLPASEGGLIKVSFILGAMMLAVSSLFTMALIYYLPALATFFMKIAVQPLEILGQILGHLFGGIFPNRLNRDSPSWI